MSDRLRAGRRGSIALCALLLAAGCTRGNTAGLQQSGPSASAVGDVGSPALTATPSTTTARATSTSARGSGPSITSLADTAGRPAKGAKPVFTVSTVPTFYCETTHTLNPTLVAYDDGTVLIADELGAYCDPLPRVRVGVMDRTELDRLAIEFFGSPEATVDMTTMLATDGPDTTVRYHPVDGGATSVRVYSLGSEESSESTRMPAEERQARKKLAGLIKAVTATAESGSRWVPDRLVVVGGMEGGPGYPEVGAQDPVRRWPIPLTKLTRQAIETRGNGHSCALIDDAKQVAALLNAHGDRPTAARWMVEGHQRGLAIGVALPGFPACQR